MGLLALILLSILYCYNRKMLCFDPNQQPAKVDAVDGDKDDGEGKKSPLCTPNDRITPSTFQFKSETNIGHKAK